MTIGRLTGDMAVKRLGPQRVLLGSGICATIGIAGVAAAPTPLLALPAFALTGLGIANLFPLMISAAARLPGIAPAAAVTAVATMAYTGGLAGPALIGFGAELVGLRAALAALVLAPVLILVAAWLGIVRMTALPERSP
jgi:fucose permease